MLSFYEKEVPLSCIHEENPIDQREQPHHPGHFHKTQLLWTAHKQIQEK